MPTPNAARPTWIRDTGIVSVAMPEPPYLQKYCGAQRADLDEQYDTYLSDAWLESLARAGVTLVWVRLFTGFGLEFEKAEHARVRDCFTRAHARGLKTAASVSLGTLTLETLLLEEPEAQNWLQVNQDGQHPAAGARQSFRARPCYHSESYLRYMERVCALGLECGADLIYFDAVGYNPEPDTCRCPLCAAAFREFLRAQYGAQNELTRQAGLARFGHNTFTHVRPPYFQAADDLAAPHPANSPHQQEWIRFKVHTLTEVLGRLAGGIHKHQPQCAIGADLYKGFGANTDWLYGINLPAQLPHVDLAFDLDVVHALYPSEAAFKTARAFDVAPHADLGPLLAVPDETLFQAAPADLVPLELQLAQNLAFNPFGLGHLGQPEECNLGPGWEDRLETDPQLKLLRAYLDFYARHKAELLLHTQSLAAIALFLDTPSGAYSGTAQHSRGECAQALVEHNLPFDLLYPNQLDELEQYSCIILAGCESLSDEIAARLERFVAGGGGLVLTAQTGRLDQWRRLRPVRALAAVCPADLSTACQRAVGQGRVAYLPQWPQDAEDLLDAVRFAAGDGVPWTVAAPAGTVVAEATRTAGGDLVLHVINVSSEALPELRCTLACPQAPREVLALSPAHEYPPVAFQYDNGRVCFNLAPRSRYVMCKVSFPAAVGEAQAGGSDAPR